MKMHKMTAGQKEAVRIYGLCSACREQTYCPWKGAGKSTCNHFFPSTYYHTNGISQHGYKPRSIKK